MEEIMHDLCTRKGETCGVKKKRNPLLFMDR